MKSFMTRAAVIVICIGGVVAAMRLLRKPPRTLHNLKSEEVRHYTRTDNPAARLQFELLQQQAEGGATPHLRQIFGALQDLRRERKTSTSNYTAGIPTGKRVILKNLFSLRPTAGLNPSHSGWTPLGPTAIGGRTRSIVVSQHTKVIWLGSVGGGIWRSDNAGATFTPVDDLMANLAISSIADDPNHDLMFAATGEGMVFQDGIRGAGIFARSSKGWQQIPSTIRDDTFRLINRICLSGDGKVILVATPNGIYKADARQLIAEITNPATSSPTGWEKTSDMSTGQVLFKPGDNERALAAGFKYNGTVDVLFTVNGGSTWTPSQHNGQWLNRVELAYSKANPEVVYASVDAHGGEIWRSVDGGRFFEKRATLTEDKHIPANYLGSGDDDQGWYSNAIWAGDPTSVDLLVVGGLDLWRSTNGGDTLTKISDWHTNLPHADQHAIVSGPDYDGKKNRTVLVANDGGLYRADDILTAGQANITNGWTSLNHGYSVTQFYSGTASPSGRITGGSQDNGTLNYDPASNQWQVLWGGDGGLTAADANADILYGEYINLSVFRGIDGHKPEYINGVYMIDDEHGRWKDPPYLIEDSMNPSAALFIAPFVLDPSDANRLLAGGRSLWRTTDAKTVNTEDTGPSWYRIKQQIGDGPTDLISAIAVAPRSSNIAWVGYANGQLFTTTRAVDNDPVWEKISADSGKSWPQRYISHITIDPSDSSTVYVTFLGYAKNNVWKTSDGGKSWDDISASLPPVPVRSLLVNPNNRSYLYLGTEVGVFASEDAGATWSPTNEGPTNCAVYELLWSGTKLVAATHGRGMFFIELGSGNQ